MNTTLKQLESIDSGSNYKFGEKMESPSVPRSLFDLTHSNILTMKNAGQVVPLTWWEVIQGDDYDISVDSLLRVLPQVVPLMSRQRLYVYAFYSRYSDLWNNYQVFMDRGYTGNVIKKIPCLQNEVNFLAYTGYSTIFADSLFDYMGLPIGADVTKLFGANSSDTDHIRISALPFMMFLRIWRDYFMNRNEYINNRVILPDDDSRFRLNDNGHLLSAQDQSQEFYFMLDGSYDYSEGNGASYFSGFYHEWPSDYFISALPFTQRGTAPELKYNVDLSQLGVDFSNSIHKLDDTPNNVDDIVGITYTSMSSDFKLDTLSSDLSINPSNRGLLNSLLSNGKVSGNFGLSIILEDIRKLAIAQTELEKLARTDGSYAQFGLTFFGEISKAAYDFRPIYIGGTYKNIAFTEVLQTSSSTAAVESGEEATPLGSMAGHGITGMKASDNRIGHIHCDDNGIIMILGCIMPDVIYSDGIDRSFVESLQAEKYIPERSKLGLQPIYNYELFYAGNNSSSEGGDLYLWAHQNAFDHHRYKQNKIHGKVADKTNKSFYPFTQARKFNNLVNWGRNFSEAKDVRKDYLAASSEDAYIAQFKFNIRAVRPLPYRGTPAKII